MARRRLLRLGLRLLRLLRRLELLRLLRRRTLIIWKWRGRVSPVSSIMEWMRMGG